MSNTVIVGLGFAGVIVLIGGIYLITRKSAPVRQRAVPQDYAQPGGLGQSLFSGGSSIVGALGRIFGGLGQDSSGGDGSSQDTSGGDSPGGYGITDPYYSMGDGGDSIDNMQPA